MTKQFLLWPKKGFQIKINVVTLSHSENDFIKMLVWKRQTS